MSLYQISFWLALIFTILGALLGLVGIWVKDFWRDEIGFRLVMTDVVLAVASIIVAAITKWLK